MMEVTKTGKISWFLVLVILWSFACGMAQPETQNNISPLVSELWKTEKIPETKLYRSSLLSLNKTDLFNHTIKWPGENLGIVARWYTGSLKNWIHLVEANPGINPSLTITALAEYANSQIPAKHRQTT